MGCDWGLGGRDTTLFASGELKLAMKLARLESYLQGLGRYWQISSGAKLSVCTNVGLRSTRRIESPVDLRRRPRAWCACRDEPAKVHGREEWISCQSVHTQRSTKKSLETSAAASVEAETSSSRLATRVVAVHSMSVLWITRATCTGALASFSLPRFAAGGMIVASAKTASAWRITENGNTKRRQPNFVNDVVDIKQRACT
eukprot:3472821-Pleurochrysis_carterae.AAC.1